MATQDHGPIAAPGENQTLVDQTVEWITLRIRDNVFRPGMRVPSVRQLADTRKVSRFTVVEAYERLVARGVLQARRGSGFFVREAAISEPVSVSQRGRSVRLRETPARIDTDWLIRNMLPGAITAGGEAMRSPGSGYIDPNLLQGDDLVRQSLRGLVRQPLQGSSQSSSAAGYLPLRQQLQRQLAGLEIAATPEQVVLTAGTTHAIDLIARAHLQPGDTVLTGDPAWFTMFGLLSVHGVRCIGFPYLPDGPDLDRLAELVRQHKPKMLIINSVLHNPTGTTLSMAAAYRILRLAEEHDIILVEDDVFVDLWPEELPCGRIASLDQLRHVYYLAGYTKTLSPSIRVGFVACSTERAERLAHLKMLTMLSTPELPERLVYRTLTEGGYRRSCERLRETLVEHRDRAIRSLERVGLRIWSRPAAGFFGYFDTGVDTSELSVRAQGVGFILAPGALFSPTQAPSTWMRCNFTRSLDPAWHRWLAQTLERGG